MKKSLVALATLFVVASAFAEESKETNWYDVSSGYGSYEYSYKEKQNVTTGELHDVQTLTLGARLQHGWSVEIVDETERVDFQAGTASYTSTNSATAQAMEGLTQFCIGKSFKIEENNFLDNFTPYVKLSYGHKFKSNIDFAIYRYDLGTNIKVSDSFGVQWNWRHRQALDDTIVIATDSAKATNYKTNEQAIGLIYKFTPKDSIRLAKKIERADASGNLSSEYNTTSLTYSRSF